MPRDSNGAYSLPPVYLAITGQTVLAEQHNTPLTDIASALTGSLPRNGTGSMLGNLPMGNNRITNLANATSSTDAATLAQAQSAGVPIGSVLDFAGAQAPTGFFLCYGQAVSRSTYAALFAVIGTTYGAGDGATTFNVPNYRGLVLAGLDNMGGTSAARLTEQGASTTLGSVGGAQTVSLTAAQNGPHDHSFSGSTSGVGDHSHGITTNGGGAGGVGVSNSSGGAIGTFSTGGAGAHSHTFSGTTSASGSGQAHLNIQPTAMTNKIIKAFTP